VNTVYLITCNNCRQQYVGYTTCKLTEAVYDLLKPPAQKQQAAAEHLEGKKVPGTKILNAHFPVTKESSEGTKVRSSCNRNDLRIRVLIQRQDPAALKTERANWIQKLHTDKNGLNKKIPDQPITCPDCKQVCKSPAGYDSHKRNTGHDKKDNLN
jgi:hypothetical protein